MGRQLAPVGYAVARSYDAISWTVASPSRSPRCCVPARAAAGAASIAASGPAGATALGALRSFRDRRREAACADPYSMALYGVAMSLVERLFLQMAREFGSSKRLMGAVTLVGTTTELPIFHRAARSSRV